MQTTILIIVCVRFCGYIYVVLKGASNAQRLRKERDEIYKLEKEIGEQYRAEVMFRIKDIEEKCERILYRQKRRDKEPPQTRIKYLP